MLQTLLCSFTDGDCARVHEGWKELSVSKTIYDTNFAETLSTAMNDFHEALTKRWREEYVEAVKDISYNYPTVIQRATSPTAQTLWETQTREAREHIGRNYCEYIKWVEGGQEGPLSAVTCEGKTGVHGDPVEVPGLDADGDEMVKVPAHINCGMGKNLKLIDQWAYGERDNVYYKLPLFDTHDQHKLESAHDAFIKIGKELGLEAAKDSADSVGSFEPVDERELAGYVDGVSAERSDGKDFWAGWTGLAANRAKAGFFSSVTPSLNNQSGITGSLANLYSARAAIIQRGRNNSLYSIQQATKACGEKAKVTTDLRGIWNAASGVGAAVTVYGTATGPGAPAAATVGASLSLVGFLGEKLLPKTETEDYKHGVEAIVNQLNQQIDQLNSTLGDMESDYGDKVNQLNSTISGIHSYNLELYDLTQNNADGDHGGDEKGYTADVEDILQIGKLCYDAGDRYNALLPTIKETADADKHLSNQDGEPTSADTSLLEIRDQFKGFLNTSTGRYIVAGQQTEAAAKEYAQGDEDKQAALDRILGDWKDAGVGDIDVHGDPGDMADETDRDGGNSGKNGNGDDYATDND